MTKEVISETIINKQDVIGLPAGAKIQYNKTAGTSYVYFSYSFRKANGEPGQERDYLGTVDTSVTPPRFKPNAYYLTVQPVREKRPLERWKDAGQRAKYEALLKEEEQVEAARPEAKLDPDNDQEMHLGVGITALAARILYDNGSVEDIAAALDFNLADTMAVLNLAMYAAMTSKPTYLAHGESKIQKFIGTGCLSSPRASELFVRIGSSLDLSKKIGRLRAERLTQPGDLLALDGTRIDCNSGKISLAAVGKKKDGTFGPQINFSMVVNATTGDPISYRYYAGNTNDSSTMEDFRAMFKDYGIHDRDVQFVMDRGYFKSCELAEWNAQGLKYIVGTKTNISAIKEIIDDDNCEFFAAQNLLKHHFAYGIKREVHIGGAQATACVYLNPNSQMIAIRELDDKLEKFSVKWTKGKASADDPLLRFFKDPVKGEELTRDWNEINQYCYMQGFFACTTNVNETPDGLLSKYRLCNEVEVLFRLMLGDMYRTTRLQSTPALEGQVFTVFVGLGILGRLRQALMNKVPARKNVRAASVDLIDPEDGTRVLLDWVTISELITRLRKIMLVKEHGKCRLLHVTQADKDFVAQLGYPGLFDSADEVDQLLSAKRLADTIRAAKAAAMPRK